MANLLRNAARFAVRKLASDPAMRAKANGIAREIVTEAKQVYRDPDRPYAAGRAVRRALDRLRESN
jgi:predicted transcriptional regulator